jgi:hypothetical protein
MYQKTTAVFSSLPLHKPDYHALRMPARGTPDDGRDFAGVTPRSNFG